LSSLHDPPPAPSKHLTRCLRNRVQASGDLPKRRQLACHKRSDGFRDIYGRMAWDEVAPTITSGCFNPSKGRFLHPERNRAITMREAALLQSFPRSYKFELSVGKEAIALMIGNALPPEFIRRHALEIRASLERRA
ncbi:MAG: DNA cytosine methyltransferase, partial [Xanthobacteraceae bacterium]|nr:DNA cytosine methyltransferase [Xanthobacteraceae bacterium]